MEKPCLSVLIDCGEGTVRQLTERHVKVKSTCAVLLTAPSPHAFGGLPALLFHMADTGSRAVRVLGQRDTVAAACDSALAVFGRQFPAVTPVGAAHHADLDWTWCTMPLAGLGRCEVHVGAGLSWDAWPVDFDSDASSSSSTSDDSESDSCTQSSSAASICSECDTGSTCRAEHHEAAVPIEMTAPTGPDALLARIAGGVSAARKRRRDDTWRAQTARTAPRKGSRAPDAPEPVPTAAPACTPAPCTAAVPTTPKPPAVPGTWTIRWRAEHSPQTWGTIAVWRASRESMADQDAVLAQVKQLGATSDNTALLILAALDVLPTALMMASSLRAQLPDRIPLICPWLWQSAKPTSPFVKAALLRRLWRTLAPNLTLSATRGAASLGRPSALPTCAISQVHAELSSLVTAACVWTGAGAPAPGSMWSPQASQAAIYQWLCTAPVAAQASIRAAGSGLEAWTEAAALASAAPDPACPRLLVLGTAGAVANKYRATTALYIQLSNAHSLPDGMLLDAGDGCVAQLAAAFGAWHPGQPVSGCAAAVLGLRGVWISHDHADHTAGLVGLLALHNAAAAAYHRAGSGGAIPPLAVCAPPRSHALLQAAGFRAVHGGAQSSLSLGAYRAVSRSRADSTVFLSEMSGAREWAPDYHGAQLLDISTVAVRHCKDAQAWACTVACPAALPFRFVFSGDTRPCSALRRLAHQADLLVHEATFADADAKAAANKAHCTVSEALQQAAESDAKTVLLSHFSARYTVLPPVVPESCAQPVACAYDGLCLPLAHASAAGFTTIAAIQQVQRTTAACTAYWQALQAEIAAPAEPVESTD